MSLAGYARIKTNLEGRVFRVDELTGITEYAQDYLFDSMDSIKGDDELQEKDCDLLVTINIEAVECGSWERREYEDEITFAVVIVLQKYYKEIFKKQIRELDEEITNWDEGMKLLGSRYYEDREDAKQHLYELHDDYLHAYEEDIEIKN